MIEKIKEKPAVKESVRDRTRSGSTPASRIIRKSATQYKEALRDAAEEGQSSDDYGGQQISDFVLDSPRRAVHAGRQLVYRQIRKRPKDSTPEHPSSEPSLAQRHAAEQGKKLAEKRGESRQKHRHSEIAAPAQTTKPSGSTHSENHTSCPNIREKRRTQTIRTKESRPGLPVKRTDRVIQRSTNRSNISASIIKAPQKLKRGYPIPASPVQQRMGNILTGQRNTVKRAGTTVRNAVQAIRKSAAVSKSLTTAIAAGGAGVAVLVILIVVLLGSVLNLTGGDNASAVSPVSAEVQAYEPTIRLYATQYGIPEYVELIKAVMMQESGGRGLDPMQAAEGGYNTRYPHVPNGITDPDYSIQCGVQELRDALDRAGVENPLDMEHIKLALQSYNFGPGYCTWAVSNYGGYSLTNAAEFSDMKAAELGWSRYGDKEYVAHVLRYYAFGRLPTGTGNGAIVQIALTQEGNGGDTYWRWYGFDSRVSWCACFVSWCGDQAGLIDSGAMPKFSLCSDGVDWFAARGRFMDASYVPSAGDLIFFDWDHDGHVNHVGIVESVSGGKVYTVEGNSSDRVRRKSYALENSSIYGYGVTS